MHALTSLLRTIPQLLNWDWQPGIILPLLASVILYVRGVRAVWSSGQRRVASESQITCFLVGCLVLAIALVSPLHEASEQLFSAHMIQHELLMVVAAPLLILGRPAVVLLWGIPPDGRQAIARVIRSHAWKAVWQRMSRPFDAWLIHGTVIWCWHVPLLFQLTLHSELAHALQHISFLGSALLFWWAIIHPRRQSALGLSIVYLFTTAVHTAVLGALMTFARTPWYPLYGSGALAWGLTPLQDQQLAGLVMWVPAGIAYLIAALVIMRRWLRESELQVVRDERLPWATQR
jgi:cytochrome c oxidase assembly factor CtaG